MLNRLLSAIGLARPNPKRMPMPYGSVRIRPRLGVKTRTYFKFLRKVMPYLTKEDEKVLRAHYKSLEPGDVGWIRVMVSEKAYHRKYDKPNCPITVSCNETVDCGCGGRFFKGCCSGPKVGSREALEKTYYIKEFLGIDDWPSSQHQDEDDDDDDCPLGVLW